MKHCPKCSLDYFDNALEFCLEDGTKLVLLKNFDNEIPTVTKSNKPNPTTAETINLPFSKVGKTPESNVSGKDEDIKTIPKFETKNSNLIKDNIARSNKILETAPIVLSLAHNWWQWIYVNNQYYSSVTSFLVSANFLMWMLLLILAIGISFFTFKKCENKSFAYTSFIVLSINLILFLVPKR